MATCLTGGLLRATAKRRADFGTRMNRSPCLPDTA